MLSGAFLMPAFSVVTFGCQMNAHDSSRMEEVLLGAGYDKADGPESADVVVLNTCSVREKAEQKLRSEVGRLGLLKRKRPELLIGVAGCVAQQEGERLLKSLPQIDLIIGPDNIRELPSLLHDLESGGLPRVRTVFDVDEPSFLMAEPSRGNSATSAYVTVMKGCNERCSYCIVPYTRGPERYRPAREILEEIRRFVDAGVREITLLGQTVNSYRDPEGALPVAPHYGESRLKWPRGSVPREDETEFPALLYAIAEAAPELWRLRYTSPHPRHLTPSLIHAHEQIGMLAKHVHMPVQSGSNALLKRMIRRYTREEYLERTRALTEAVPGLTLSTDMIVGFPGETDEDFEASVSLVQEAGFVALFGFKYSQRPYTPALKLEDDVSEEEKSRRLTRLFEVVDAQKAAHLASLVGREVAVLVDGTGKTGEASGRTEQNEIVHIETPEGELPASGSLVSVKVERAYKNSLRGSLLQTLAASPIARDRGPSASLAPQADSDRLREAGRRSLPVL